MSVVVNLSWTGFIFPNKGLSLGYSSKRRPGACSRDRPTNGSFCARTGRSDVSKGTRLRNVENPKAGESGVVEHITNSKTHAAHLPLALRFQTNSIFGSYSKESCPLKIPSWYSVPNLGPWTMELGIVQKAGSKERKRGNSSCALKKKFSVRRGPNPWERESILPVETLAAAARAVKQRRELPMEGKAWDTHQPSSAMGEVGLYSLLSRIKSYR